jgi:glycosyltransferase involved in cell wall biosynthesis
MIAMPYVSVIIPTYNRRDSVERALRALAHQTIAPETYEVIVSIDGSQDGTREMVAAFAAPYRLCSVWQPNQGRAAARNAGIRIATGDILVFFDDDMEPGPECLEFHRRAHSIGSRLGVLGAVPVYCEDDDPPVTAYIAAKFNRHLDNLARLDHQLTLRDFYSGHFSIRREVLLEVGLFDEAFREYGNEDLELSLRLTSSGVALMYYSEALAYQHYSKDFAGLARDTIAKGRTAVLLASKHPEALPDLQLSAYGQGSWRWRLARTGLLTLSRWWSSTPDKVIALIQRLEQHQVRHLHLYYRFVLDYLYWLGAQTALRENQHSGQGLTTLVSRRET